MILAIVILGALAGTMLVAAKSGQYRTRALVQIRPIVSQNDDPNLDTTRQISPETEEAIAGSQRVGELALAIRETVAEQGGRPDEAGIVAVARARPVEAAAVAAASDRLSVSVLPDSQILAFEAVADDAEAAAALAQTSAVAYLEFRRDQATASNTESRLRLAARERALLSELDDLAVDVDEVPDGAVLSYAEVSKRQELSVIGTKFANLEALTVDPGVVLSDALVPSSPEGLPLAAGPIMGALLGLAGALTAVFLLDRNDDRLRSGHVELGALGVPLLGTAPVARRKKLTKSESGSRLYPPNTAGSDAYRRLQGTLLFNLDNQSKSVVLVAGVNDPAVATAVVANVGATAARTGRRTLVVGADLRNALLGPHLGATLERGLSDVILDGAKLVESIEPVAGVDNLSLLSAGSRLDRPADVLQSNAFARLMAAVQADYDLVVVEAPPVLRVADAVDMAALCDGSVIVADGNAESRQSIVESVRQLRSVGSEIVGVVVTDAE